MLRLKFQPKPDISYISMTALLPADPVRAQEKKHILIQ